MMLSEWNPVKRKRAPADGVRRVMTLCAAALASIVLATQAAPVLATTSIKVVVNDEPITTYDIAQRTRLIQLTTRKPEGSARRIATEELIEERLKLQEAKRRGVSVSDSEVDQAFATIAGRTKMTASKLSEALSRSGVNPSTLKDRIRGEIMWGNVVRSRFRAQVNISEQDVVAAMLKKDKDTADDAKTTEYTLTQVIFVVPKSASSGTKSQRMQEAQKLRNRFTSCDSGLKLAEGLKEVVVKPVGVRLAPELPKQLTDLLDDVAVGHVTKPIETGNGVEVYAVCDKKQLDSDAGLRNQIEGELRNKEGALMSRRYLQELRRDAVIEYR